MLSTVLSLPNGSGPSGMYPSAYVAKTFPLTHSNLGLSLKTIRHMTDVGMGL